MSFSSFFCVATGGALGAVLRWLIALSLNHLSPSLAIGTLVANALGAFLMGLCIGLIQESNYFSPAWQLFLMTGFLGALTTFSTFTAESMALLQQQNYFYFITHILLHLGGSLLCFSLALICIKLFNS